MLKPNFKKADGLGISLKVVYSNESCYLSFDRREKICIGNEFKSGKSIALNPDRFNSDLFHHVILRVFLSLFFWASEDEQSKLTRGLLI
jgi:hypothetical protein